MWLFTKYGFYSIVKKKFGDQVKPFQIRARTKVDLENLKDQVSLEENIIETLHADYPYRLIVNEDELARCMEAFKRNIDYDNFKNEVARHTDQKNKLDAYHDIWRVMYEYQKY